MTSKNFTGLPVTEKDGVLLGIITMRDLRYEKNLHYKVSKLMTQKVDLKVVEPGTSPNEARELLHKYKNETKSIFHFAEFARIFQSFKKFNECYDSNSLGSKSVFKF